MKIEDVFQKLKPLMGPKLDSLWEAYLIGDTETRKLIEHTLRITLARSLKRTYEAKEILLEPPPHEIAEGDYPLGMIYYGSRPYYPFGLREEELIDLIEEIMSYKESRKV